MEPMEDKTAVRNRRRSPLAYLAAGAAVVALLATGCGQDETGPSAVASLGDGTANADGGNADAGAGDGDGAKSFEEGLLEFARCMREQGVDMPDPATGGGGGGMVVVKPGSGGGDVDDEKFEAADQRCGHLLEGSEPDLSPEEMDRMQDEMLAFARCMREHGIDMPDPEADGSMTMAIGDDGVDLHDPDFQAAEKECRPEGATGVEAPSGGADPRRAVSS
ncbi:MAG: hypothetical protein M3N37_07605 [Actinomycetota bacterium]|nr:hypothetical protein [Actinomycetota bacterium]